jgi:CRP-like cAMP-binding protein
MIYSGILQNVSKHITLTSDETEYFKSLLTFKEVKKSTCLLNAGNPCRQLSYVHNGVLRSYCLDKEGRESTIMFAVTDWWVTDMYCYLNEKPAMMYIEAIEHSSIFQLSRQNFTRLFGAIPKFERFFRILMQNAYTREQLRIIENLTMTAEERYERFLQKYPHVASLVTQKQIASYLGITPEFLSVIRKKKTKRGIS